MEIRLSRYHMTIALLAVTALTGVNPTLAQEDLPVDPIEVGLNQPQMFCDDHLVENRFSRRILNAAVPHVLHKGVPHPDNPLIVPDQPWEEWHGLAMASVLYDANDELFKMYYCTWRGEQGKTHGIPGNTFTSYAQSKDGIHWEKPALDHVPWGEHAQTNIVTVGTKRSHGFHVLDIPERMRKGKRFVAFHTNAGGELLTSDDGLEWEVAGQMFPFMSDCWLTVLYDETRDEFVSYLRNTLINYHGWVEEDVRRKIGRAETASTRLISRLTSPDLWAEWGDIPAAMLIPDAGDADLFYGMPTFRYGGVYWGFLQHYKLRSKNEDTIEVELVTSRDGLHWNRQHGKPMFLPRGGEGAWDMAMVSPADRVIEVGDEWWLYYTGIDGYHGDKDFVGRIGVLKFRKEGFISIRSDGANDSYLVTRTLRWPGGDLYVNADAGEEGSVQVRVTDMYRKPVEGFGYEQSRPLEGDHVRHKMQWDGADINDLKGQLIRLEFKFKSADLYAFVAGDGSPGPRAGWYE